MARPCELFVVSQNGESIICRLCDKALETSKRTFNHFKHLAHVHINDWFERSDKEKQVAVADALKSLKDPKKLQRQLTFSQTSSLSL